MLEIYEDELDKIISGLEQELNDLLKERKKMFFTFKLDRQVSRIKNLLKKYKAESKKFKDKPKTRKTIAFIKGLIRKILGLNLIASRILIERKEAEQASTKSEDKKDDSPEKPEKPEKLEDKEKQENKESNIDSENKEILVKKSKEKSKQQSPLGKESLFTHVDKEDISSLSSIHPKTLDVHLISLLELEKTASDFAFMQSPKEVETVDHHHDKHHDKRAEESTHHAKEIIESRIPDHVVHLTEDIKKHHDTLLNILNKQAAIDTKEYQLRESNLYNTKQLYLLNNYFLRHREKRNFKDTTQLLEFTPLLVGSLVKLEVLMQTIEKYLFSLSKTKKQKTLAEKHQIEMKKHGGVTRIEHLARNPSTKILIKSQLDANASYVKKHKLSKTSGHRHSGNL